MTESVLNGLRAAQQHDSSNVLAGLKAAQSGETDEPSGDNIGYLQQIAIDKKRKEREKKESQQPIKTDNLSESVSRELGVPEEMLDTSGAGFGTRFNFSFSDDEEDIREKFKKMHPNGEIYRLEYNQTYTDKSTGNTSQRRAGSSVLVYREKAYDDEGNILPITKDSKVKTIEGDQAGYKDIADVAGSVPPLAGAIALPMVIGPQGLIVQSVASGVGWGLGELAKHEINIFSYKSELSQREALADAAKEARDMTVLTAVTGGTYKAGKWAVQRSANLAMSASSPELQAVQKEAMRFVEKQKVVPLDADQLLQENMIAQRLGMQARSTSAKAKHKAVAQKTSVTNFALDNAKGSIERIGKKLVKKARAIYNNIYNSAINSIGGRGRITSEQGGIAATAGGRAWQKSTKTKMTNSWNEVDVAAEASNPVFALNVSTVEGKRSVRQVIHDAETFVLAEIKTLEAQGLNVADTPIGKLRGIINDIKNISSQQTDYNVIKQLKTRTGEVIERWPWDASVNAHQARALYGSLSEVMLNPVNANPATKLFAQKAARATGVSRAYYDVLDSPAIRRIIQSESPAALATALGTPGALTPAVRSFISEMPGNYARTFKESVIYNDILLRPTGSRKAIDEWVMKHPEGLDFIAPRNVRKELYAAADSMDVLRNSNISAAMAADVKSTQVGKTMLLKPGTGPSETKLLAEKIGPEGVDMLRTTIYHDIVDRAVSSTGRYGQATLNADALGKAISEYKATGAWQHILTPADRAKIKGMNAYINLLYKGAADAGVSLEAAKAITELKSPSTFISGAHKLTVNAIVARVMESRSFTEWAISHNLNSPVVVDLARGKLARIRWLAMIAESLSEGTQPAEQDPAGDYIDAAQESVTGFDPQPAIDKIKELNIPGG